MSGRSGLLLTGVRPLSPLRGGDGGPPVHVRVQGGRIAEVGAGLAARSGEEVVDGAGGLLLPGLHDHHLHLLSLAAALTSVRLGPPAVETREELIAALRRADDTLPAGEWLRGVGYHESVAGPLDHTVLDAAVRGRPVRVQHRSGAEWTVNSEGARLLRLSEATVPGVERDATGVPTGRLHRLDDWLASRVGTATPDLRPVGDLLARYGVTSVTDATPTSAVETLDLLAAAAGSGALPQDVTAMVGPDLAGSPVPAPLRAGPVKILLSEPDLPGIEQVVRWLHAAHAALRVVAVHSVTRESLALALTAWREAGVRPGDRVEHASVVPPEFAMALAELGITVVTQPGFVSERGDEYLRDVDAHDVAHLYPCRTLLDAGVSLGGSTDAPFGDANPWRAIGAAVARRTRSGATVGKAERLSPRQALELFLTPADQPGGRCRTVTVGAPADLALLATPVLAEAVTGLGEELVAATIRAGRLVYRRQ